MPKRCIDFSKFGDLTMPEGGESFELEVDYSRPGHDRPSALDVFRYWVGEEGISRSDMPAVAVGDEVWLSCTLEWTGERVERRARCSRMTSERVYFELE